MGASTVISASVADCPALETIASREGSTVAKTVSDAMRKGLVRNPDKIVSQGREQARWG
jgi:hypothetical protein